MATMLARLVVSDMRVRHWRAEPLAAPDQFVDNEGDATRCENEINGGEVQHLLPPTMVGLR
jgi:hypothetical protein